MAPGFLRVASAAILAGIQLLGCESRVRKPAAVPVATVARPVLYVPADLDLVVRLDIRLYRETMGPDPAHSLERLWESFGPGQNQSADSREPLRQLLKSCDSLWLGCRLSAEGCRDFVLVLRGDWPRPYGEYGFGQGRNKRDVGRGWLSYDFDSARRSSVARLYWKPPEIAILVSSAEIDSAEQAIEKSRDSTTLEPNEVGLLSLVARSHALALLLRPRSPKGADWLEQAERVEMGFDPSTLGTLATFTVSFGDESVAQRSAKAFRILVMALAGFDARFKFDGVQVQQLGSNVVLRVQVPTDERAPE